MVYIKSYDAPPINRGEILRYAGGAEDAAAVRLMESCIEEMEAGLSYKVCYTELPLLSLGSQIKMGDIAFSSADLAKCLIGCDRVMVFAATVGIYADRLIRKYSAVSPARTLMLEAVGSERTESLCDAFCCDMQREAEARGEKLRPRFSAGYGDLPLELQREIFALLDPPKRIGLTLSESLLMVPAKSVTAIVGIYRREK